MLLELEQAAAGLGYRRIHLTTGPRQPEAAALYLAAGYLPAFDLHADPESIGPHAVRQGAARRHAARRRVRSGVRTAYGAAASAGATTGSAPSFRDWGAA